MSNYEIAGFKVNICKDILKYMYGTSYGIPCFIIKVLRMYNNSYGNPNRRMAVLIHRRFWLSLTV